MRLLVSSEEDMASRGIRRCLLELAEWREVADFSGEFVPPVLRSGDMLLVTIRDIHLYEDGLDQRAMAATGYPVDEVVFLSRHRAASGIPTLTVHPIGNHGAAEHGGREGTLVPSAPGLMTAMLRTLREEAEGLPFGVSFEVTHHGPWLSSPTLFIEIGSNEEWWGHEGAAKALARTVLSAEGTDDPVAIGVGGGHYAPRFTDMALGYHIAFGHMVPNYAMEGKEGEELAAMLERARDASGASIAYIHRKSMKRPRYTEVRRILEDMGMRVVSSRDLDPL